MRQAHTVEQVRAAEAALMASLPDGVLMQRAAAGLAYAVLDLLGGGYGRRVLLLVGSGDNGGDALYAGGMLARRGVQVEARLVSEKVHEQGLAELRRAGGRVTTDGPTTRPDVVVDGIVGIGGRPGLKEDAKQALREHPGVPVVAVDVPSGVDVDSGETPEEPDDHVHADVTVTFGTHKVAHLVEPAAGACGAVTLVDIGLDPHLPEAPVEALRADDVTRLVTPPDGHAHKYTRGVVGVRAGSNAYPGAGLLAVAGANSGLAGMVRYVGDDEVARIVKARHPEVVGEGRVQAWAVGSGTGEDAEAHLLEARQDGVPLVVDADALGHVHGTLGTPTVLTPHAGELAAMTAVDRADIEARGLHHARAAAERTGAVVLLKGRHTLIAHPDGRVRVTTSGTPWLATAGAGDVLTGLIGALLASGLDAYDAASAGSWIHGSAATLASRGGPITAGDVARAIPDVVRLLAGSR